MKQSANEGVQILKDLGARVELNQETHEKLAVIDNAIVWHGSLNILSQGRSSESMMRFVGENTARQLLADVGLKVETVLRPESFAEIRDGMRGVTVKGKVIQIEPVEFRRQRDGPTYRFAQAVLEADGRQCKLTLWGAETDLVKEGDTIRIINGYTREYNGVTTLHSGKYGKIEVLESRGIDRSSAPSAQDTVRSSEENATGAPTPIADLRDGMTDVTVEGTVVKVEPPRKVSENKRVANALLEDESGAIKLVLWEKQIDEIAQGSKVRIQRAYVKTWSNERQLHAGRTGIIVPVGKRTDQTSPAATSQSQRTSWIAQNANKRYPNGSLSWWAEQARKGHVIEWEMDESGYTGKVRLDGEIMLKEVARKKLERISSRGKRNQSDREGFSDLSNEERRGELRRLAERGSDSSPERSS